MIARTRKPRIDLVGFKNDHGVVTRAGRPNMWFILCTHCGGEHEQVGRNIQRNSHTLACPCKKPHNYSGRTQKDNYIRKQYGITLGEFNQRVSDQGGMCAICGRPDEVVGRSLNIDHCHEPGVVRGLLCGGCNRALGLFQDSVEILSRAVEYMKPWANAR